MTWTSEYPTKPGFYWIRNYRLNCYGGSPDAVIADSEPVKISADMGLWFTGDDRPYDRMELDCAEWQGPIEPEIEGRCSPATWNFEAIALACRDCRQKRQSFVSWQIGEVDGKPQFGIICRECWIKRLTPEQRKVYMV